MINKNKIGELYENLDENYQELLKIMTLVGTPFELVLMCEICKKFNLLTVMSNSGLSKVLQKHLRSYLYISYWNNEYEVDDDVKKYILDNFCIPKNKESIEILEQFIQVPTFKKNPIKVYFSYLTYYLEIKDHYLIHECTKAMSKLDKKEMLNFWSNKIKKGKLSLDILNLIPTDFVHDIITHFYNTNILSFKDYLDILSFFKETLHYDLPKTLTEHLISQGLREGKEIQLFKLLKEYKIYDYNLDTFHDFLKGDFDTVRNRYTRLTNFKNIDNNIIGIIAILSMLMEGNYKKKKLLKLLNAGSQLHSGITEKISRTYTILYAYLHEQKGDENAKVKRLISLPHGLWNQAVNPIFQYFLTLVSPEKKRAMGDLNQDLVNSYKNESFLDTYWYYCIIKKMYPNNKIDLTDEQQELIDEYSKKYIDFTDYFKRKVNWELSLKKLIDIAERNKIAGTANKDNRLVWLFEDNDGIFKFTAKEQTLGKNGLYTKGKNVNLKKIKESSIECMSSIDKELARNLTGKTLKLNWRNCVDSIIKHPHIYLESAQSTPVEFVKDSIQFFIKENDDGYDLSLSDIFDKKGIKAVRETATKYKILEVTDEIANIAKAIGNENSLKIPKKSKSKLKQIVNNFSSLLTVHSDVAGDSKENKIEKVKGDNTPHIQILPFGDGIKAEIFVRPFKKEGPYFKPGYGGSSVISEIKGVNKRAIRDLDKEIEMAEQTIAETASLIGDTSDIFTFKETIAALEMLLELSEIKDKIVIEWPEGEKLKLLKIFSSKDMTISMRKSHDWFEINGDLKVDAKRVVSFQQLLDLQSNDKFIELSNGEFIALTDELKKRIAEVANYSLSIDGKNKIHKLNANLADDILSEMPGFKSVKTWKDNVKSANAALDFKPEIPSTLQVDFRPYQLEGFNWLSRLSHWGVGACLADDMGLGKTIQALGVILERAKNGPTLVIAPSSVCLNWIAEAAKFAPTLNTTFFGEGNRKEHLNDLKPFDLILCSYGLLMSESDEFSKIKWTTTVLDEAQSIKNYKAKRTQAALKLDSDFRLITTGTPVENHLAELWSLFNFINPGLLGTIKEFNENFAIPIEKNNDKTASKSLRKILRPFILRRLKRDVLEDLPEKTEINLSIEMSEEEMSFYEALRRNSVEKIEGAKDEKGGAIHIKILAELTRLRRACCHPSLIQKDIGIESSKINQFIKIVEELKENNHKALVFSQFTGYLDIIRKVCDARNITYQYLDGSTPTKKRQGLVDKFQAGEGDIFLISLKAGGTGLNLTAADYVIHMDPWWNPAVEDQASDRAHRIGQKRPVTVYRFVTKNTVEERIISLHKSKRELADSLLDGADVTGKMSANDLLELLR